MRQIFRAYSARVKFGTRIFINYLKERVAVATSVDYASAVTVAAPVPALTAVTDATVRTPVESTTQFTTSPSFIPSERPLLK
jgi:hypothetical protein